MNVLVFGGWLLEVGGSKKCVQESILTKLLKPQKIFEVFITCSNILQMLKLPNNALQAQKKHIE